MSNFFNLTNNSNRNAQELLILGISWDASSSYRLGSLAGPDYIREATSSKLYNSFTETGVDLTQRWNIIDLGNVDAETMDMSTIIDDITNLLREYRENIPIVFLGGDHLITYLCLHALKPKNVGIIYFDAHPDLYISYEGDRYSHACVLQRVLEHTEINPQNIVQIGIRASTQEQRKFSKENDLLVFTRKEVHSLGIESLGTQVREKLSHLDQIYLSIDLDVLDPAHAPGVGCPEPGGLSTSDIIDLIHEFVGLPIHFADIVEINPQHDSSKITGYTAAKIIKEILGVIL